MKPSLENLICALQASWTADTCFDAAQWSDTNPARGQCVVSSLVIQKYLGGDLLRYRVSGHGTKETHYCNILQDGTILDTTASQYKLPMTFRVDPVTLGSFVSIREKRLADGGTRTRYKLLLSRVELRLKSRT